MISHILLCLKTFYIFIETRKFTWYLDTQECCSKGRCSR